MQVVSFHVFACDQQKPEGVPCCGARGAAAVIDELRAEVARQGLAASVQVTACGSIGLCERGPNLVVYPEGTWYSGVQAGDVREIVESHFLHGHVVERLVNRDPAALRQEISQNRTRMIEARREKDASGALPDDLLQTIRAFQESRVILTAIELDVFSAVAAGSTTRDAAERIGADVRSTEMLLNALVAVRLLEKRGDRFLNTPTSARYLAAGGADDSRAALMHTVHLWTNWSQLTDSVRAGTAAARRPDGSNRGQPWTEAFIAAMHKNATERAPALVRAVNVGGARRLLDVGGGSGAYSIAFAKASPQLSVDLLDLPTVTPIAQRHIVEAGLQHRIRTHDGDLTVDRLGENYDLILVSAICHMLSPAENQDLLNRCFEASAPDGRVVIQDFILDGSKTNPKAGALFALNMLVGTRAGSAYSEIEYEEWLRAAGFRQIEHVRLPGPTGLMIGRHTGHRVSPELGALTS